MKNRVNIKINRLTIGRTNSMIILYSDNCNNILEDNLRKK